MMPYFNNSSRTKKPDEKEQTSKLFQSAQHENWNFETDWLWLAQQLENPDHQRYCLQRALYVNPDSKTAKQALAQLHNQQIS